jgi:hypothetical protein
MRHNAMLGSLFVLATCSPGAVKESPRRAIPCKTPANAASCYWTHGRLREANGTPSYTLWKIGTHRLLGIYSGPSVDRYGLDSEGPEFPPNVSRAFEQSKMSSPYDITIYADFEVCPLEPEKPDAMQAACIESAKNLFAKKEK